MVLVVDDELGIRELITATLQASGFAVHSCADPAEALAWLEKTGWKVDIIISDVLMPRLDGLAFCQALRKRAPDVALLLMSGHLQEEDLWVEGARTLPYLAKPFTATALLGAVADALALNTRPAKGSEKS